MKIAPIKQKNKIACGPACIKMVSDYFKLPYSFPDIEKVSNYKKRGGLSNKELVDVLGRLGLHVKTKSNSTWMNLKKLNTKNKVIILSWMLDGYIGHFSILESITKKSINLVDPALGNTRKLEKIVFLRLWFDYDEHWYPLKNTDIQLRWLAEVSAPKRAVPL